MKEQKHGDLSLALGLPPKYASLSSNFGSPLFNEYELYL